VLHSPARLIGEAGAPLNRQSAAALVPLDLIHTYIAIPPTITLSLTHTVYCIICYFRLLCRPCLGSYSEI